MFDQINTPPIDEENESRILEEEAVLYIVSEMQGIYHHYLDTPHPAVEFKSSDYYRRRPKMFKELIEKSPVILGIITPRTNRLMGVFYPKNLVDEDFPPPVEPAQIELERSDFIANPGKMLNSCGPFTCALVENGIEIGWIRQASCKIKIRNISTAGKANEQCSKTHEAIEDVKHELIAIREFQEQVFTALGTAFCQRPMT
jgi:hypothetical protein